MIHPTPEQRAEMAAFIDAKQPGLLDDLGIQRQLPDDMTDAQSHMDEAPDA